MNLMFYSKLFHLELTSSEKENFINVQLTTALMTCVRKFENHVSGCKDIEKKLIDVKKEVEIQVRKLKNHVCSLWPGMMNSNHKMALRIVTNNC